MEHAGAGSASEIKVLTAGAFKPVVMDLVADFERESGHTVVVENDTAAALTRSILGGEAVRPDRAQDRRPRSDREAGRIDGASRVRLAQVGIGVAVKAGTAAPDVSSVAAFEQALLDGRAVAYIDPAAGGSSGIYLSRLFEKMDSPIASPPRPCSCREGWSRARADRRYWPCG